MKKIFIIAEAGVNHNGSPEIANRMVDVAVEAGADAVKFQTWRTENVVTATAGKALYQKITTGEEGSQYDMLKKLELDYSVFSELKMHADRKGIIFISTPDDEESVNFLDGLDVPLFKIGSGEITNLSFLRYVAEKRKPIILSTGMSCLGEVEKAVNVIKDVQATKGVNEVVLNRSKIPPLTILHCVSSYPSPVIDCNLMAIQTMSNAFSIPVGYSDHTLGTAISIAAVAVGAQVIEKHFTLDRNMAGPDHKASLEPHELKALVNAIRDVQEALGDGVKRLMPSEKDVRDVVRRNLVAVRDISENSIIAPDMIAAKRTENGISAEFRDMLLGRKANRNIRKDETLEWAMFS